MSASAEPVRVWYRSSEGCPDGTAFLERLRAFGRSAVLAGVGDRVDFVVTVAHAGNQSSGRLERQSREQTVAIRDVSAATCAEVVEVLALSLDLAEQPAVAGATPAADDAHWQTRLGAQGTVESGLARLVFPGGAVFVDLRPGAEPLRLRASLRGAYRERDDDIPLNVLLLASRVEACWLWSLRAVGVGPCAGVDIGLIRAESVGDNGLRDSGVWSSGVVHARGVWGLAPALALEAQAGVLVPFVRYRFSAEAGGQVEDSAPLGLAMAIGLSFGL
ncbi:MAG: hypothetical protein ABW217_19870 [Polyangiaceae bacterium]